MCDEWMPALKLALTLDEFHQLPRHPAYKYEYLQGTAYLSPRARHYHAVLDLAVFAAPLEMEERDEVSLRPLQPDDFGPLEPEFQGAFHRHQPFASLDDATRQQAAHVCLERTRAGGDGPLVEAASFVAVQAADGKLRGAVLVTLLPPGDPCEYDDYYWREPPPPDCVARHYGRAHLTWIFVAPPHAAHGVGTALLAASVRRLRELGYTELYSTFLLGNESSMLWHWRNGFRLLSYPGSLRRMRERARRSLS
jgi:GNAT superfamily N-acetyltransferase